MNTGKMLSYAFPILEIKGDTKQNREISEDLRNSGKYHGISGTGGGNYR